MPHFGEIQSLDDLIDVVLAALADGDVLTYDAATGQWINQAIPPGATKEFFYSVTPCVTGAATFATSYGHSGTLIDALDETGFVQGYVPHDFSSLTSIVAVIKAQATETPMAMRIRVCLAADGEATNTHCVGPSLLSINTTSGNIHEVDISALVPAMAAGDYIGLSLTRGGVDNTNLILLGVRLRYT